MNNTPPRSSPPPSRSSDEQRDGDPKSSARLVVAWALVGVPLAYGLVETVRRASSLFGG